ncbi:hypothetical protein KKG58_05170 [Patescibacteria group bacterium]|nr:hypothetical protein [Patescibacteria group bacterium]
MKGYTHTKKKPEFRLFKIRDRLRLFSKEIRRDKILTNIRPKVEKRIKEQTNTQLIGQIREKKVIAALEDLKKKGKIHDYFQSGKLSYADLIEGIDFIFVYVKDVYHVCYFSVTGSRWVDKHLEKHPEIPVLNIRLDENRESIEKKILKLEEESKQEK